MSRFGDGGDGDGDGITPEMWRHNVGLAINGKRGQAALREMLRALEEMPEHRLIRDELVNPEQGCACAIGAWAAWKFLQVGKADTWQDALVELRRLYGGEDDGTTTAIVGHQELGITRTLATHLAYENDDGYFQARTPEELWQATYDYVKGLIKADA